MRPAHDRLVLSSAVILASAALSAPAWSQIAFPMPERLRLERSGDLTAFDGLFLIGKPVDGEVLRTDSEAWGAESLATGVEVGYAVGSGAASGQGYCTVRIHPLAEIPATREQLVTAAEFGEPVPRQDGVSRAGGAEAYVRADALQFERAFSRGGSFTAQSEISVPAAGWARADIRYLGSDDEDTGYNGRAAILVVPSGDGHYRLEKRCSSYAGDTLLDQIWQAFYVTPAAWTAIEGRSAGAQSPPAPLSPVPPAPLAPPSGAASPNGSTCRTVQTYSAGGRLVSDREVCTPAGAPAPAPAPAAGQGW